MQLNELKPKNALRKKQKRVGRGGKRGTTAGRGQKGQRARSGHRIRPAERDLLIRIPKLRGIKNKSISDATCIVNVGELTRMFPSGVVNKRAFVDLGLVRNTSARIKILSGGEVKKALTVEGIELSAEAKKKIEAAGGSIK